MSFLQRALGLQGWRVQTRGGANTQSSYLVQKLLAQGLSSHCAGSSWSASKGTTLTLVRNPHVSKLIAQGLSLHCVGSSASKDTTLTLVGNPHIVHAHSEI